jgi:hypothetical protein
VPYDILIEDLQAHADAHAVDMRAVRQREAAQTADESRRGAGVHDDSWFATYRTLDEITQYCENIALQRPELASISTIGQSWEGRDCSQSRSQARIRLRTRSMSDRPCLSSARCTRASGLRR